MTIIDWMVLLGTLLAIAAYGVYKTRNTQNVQGYFLGDQTLSWGAIGLSVMATQASAITFISTPGLAYDSGMAFVQNYFGLPLALIVVSAVFIPIYYRLKVYTAYEYLEQRFDLKSRLLAAFLFLMQRGLAAGITIYAPAIILSAALGWDLNLTILWVGILVIIYTVSGGSKAVSITQKWQMAVIMLGMFAAFGMLVYQLSDHLSFVEVLSVASAMDRMNAVNFSFDASERYTIWSGLTGGFFLALSYFGTDQSQVQRYLGGKSTTASRMGLMFNAVLKIPMQFFILLCGVLVFVLYLYKPAPLIFDEVTTQQMRQSAYSTQFNRLEEQQSEIKLRIRNEVEVLQQGDTKSPESIQTLQALNQELTGNKAEAKALIEQAGLKLKAKDSDFVFLHYIMHYLPVGMVGLLLAVIIAAAMSSTAGELSALGSTTTIDFYKRIWVQGQTDAHYLRASKWITAIWGLVAIGFALFAQMLENLIEAVNILGSLFYGTILGIFMVAFFVKWVGSKAVFYAAVLAQLSVVVIYLSYGNAIAYLWLNVIGCGLVVLLASALQRFGAGPKD